MGFLGLPELLILLVIILLVVGGKKLPDIARAIAKAINEFKKAGKDGRDDSADSA